MSNVRDLVEKVTSPPGLKSPINYPAGRGRWPRFSLAVRPSTKPDSAKRLTNGSDRFDFLEISGNPTALGLSGDVDVYLCGPPGMVESGPACREARPIARKRPFRKSSFPRATP